MKKYIYITAIASTLLFGACDKVWVDEQVVTPPIVDSFFPVEGYAGSEVTVKGSALNNVVGATIGGVRAELAQRISDTQLVVKVPAMAVSGPIALTSAQGTGTSSQSFTMTYPAPAADKGSVPSNVELASTLLINGERMSVITRVLFSSPGGEPHEAEIISQNDREVVVKVPFVESDDANISFEYFDGAQLTTTEPSEIGVKVARMAPNVTDISTSSASVGDLVTLSGEYLDKINRVLINGSECLITLQTPETVKFMVPELPEFTDGDNATSLAIEYFDGAEIKEINPTFNVSVSAVLFWQDRKVWAQGRDVEELTSFFSPQTGIAYANSMWRDLDAISYKYQEGTCSAVQVPAVTVDEYNSVVPYFFFTGVSAGNLQLNSPAGSASMLKNVFWQNNSSAESRVTGAYANCYGTPVLTFLVLDETKAGHADLIEKVRTGTLTRFDEATYPIDVEAKTCGDINISGVGNSIKDTQFAPGVFTVGQELNTDVDSYILVLYYNQKGLNASNRAENIRRIGVLHIKHIDFKLYNNTDAPSSSSITFDMYWMKRDYSGSN